MDSLGIIQITSGLPIDHPRQELLVRRIIPACIRAAKGAYVLVSPSDTQRSVVEAHGGAFSKYTGWDKDMSRKWRQGMEYLDTEWVAFFADDVVPDDTWREDMLGFLAHKPPGQYGFRLMAADGDRHEHGEDWMEVFMVEESHPLASFACMSRPLEYGADSSTAYVANCVVHKDVLRLVEPFGVFGKAPDVMWSLAIRECGFPIGFNADARAYHLGDRTDHR
tara:strand:- start:2499 stop:3164 length:666 start_codon:yes stop_codon:yes gene_type:complete